MTYEPRKITKPISLNDQELKEIGIIKQAILKSFIESGVIKERTKDSEKLIEDWVRYIRRNNEPEWKAWRESDPKVNPEATPF
jgi:hypothetical protein